MRYAVCGMHVAFLSSSSAVSRRPSAVDDARFRSSRSPKRSIRTGHTGHTNMHGHCYTTDRPGVMGGSWPGIRVYICTCTCTVCTSPKTRGDSRRLRAAGCARASPPAGRPSPRGCRTWDVVALVSRTGARQVSPDHLRASK